MCEWPIPGMILRPASARHNGQTNLCDCCVRAQMNGSTRTFRPTTREAVPPPFTESTFPDWPASNTSMTERISFDETRMSCQLRRPSPCTCCITFPFGVADLAVRPRSTMRLLLRWDMSVRVWADETAVGYGSPG